MTKEIPLTKGKVALVDDEDFDYLMRWKWQSNREGYAVRTECSGPIKANGKKKGVHIQMHRQVLKCEPHERIDHKNRIKFDNRKCNLRTCTFSQNAINHSYITGRSNYKGVSWNSQHGKWFSRVGVNKKRIFLGLFKCEKEAAKAYNDAAFKYYGEFAFLNKL